MSSEQEAASGGATSTGTSREQEAPVLPVSQSSSSPPHPVEEDGQHHLQQQPQEQEEEGEREEGTGDNAATSVSTQTERPPRGVSDLWGLDEQVDQWQISAMPEEKHYFSMDPNLISAAVSAVKSRLTEPDTNIRGTWLLTEVDHWDLEKEKLLVLTNHNLVSVRYNFIHGVIEEMKYIPLAAITNIQFGDFKYPSSYAYSRAGKALKIFWGKEENVGFMDRWNPFSTRVPFTIFASHLLMRKGRVDNDDLRVAKVVPQLEKAINDLRRAGHQQPSSAPQGVGEGEGGEGEEAEASSQADVEEYHVVHEDIVVGSVLGLGALIHNDSNLGFFKRRGLMNW